MPSEPITLRRRSFAVHTTGDGDRMIIAAGASAACRSAALEIERDHQSADEDSPAIFGNTPAMIIVLTLQLGGSGLFCRQGSWLPGSIAARCPIECVSKALCSGRSAKLIVSLGLSQLWNQLVFQYRTETPAQIGVSAW